MPYLFLKQNKNKLKELGEKDFRLEKEIQDITESNLKEIFGLEFIKSEFIIQNFSIDTLAFDKEKNSFVLIEYKRGQSFSVIDQGYAYLAAALAHQSDLVLEYNEFKNANLHRKDVDWTQTKVIFIAPSFTSYQEGAINFKDLPIDLWQISNFENNLILYNQIKPLGASGSIKSISKSKILKEISEKVKPYSIEEHLENYGSSKTKELFKIIHEEIKELDDGIEIKPFKKSVNYIINGKQFVALGIQKESIRIYLVVDEKFFQDPQKRTRDISEIGRVTAGNRDFNAKNEKDIKYAMRLIKQAYNHA